MSRERREALEGLQRAISTARSDMEGSIEKTSEFTEASTFAENLEAEATQLAFERAQVDRQTAAVLTTIPQPSRNDLMNRGSAYNSARAAPGLAAFIISSVMIVSHLEPMWLLGPATVWAAWLTARRHQQ